LLPPKEKLEEIVKSLAKIMRIQDWDIEIKVLTSQEMKKETGEWDNRGEAYRNLRYKYAIIRLNEHGIDMNEDWYHVLLHEMKHIQTTEFIYTFYQNLDSLTIPESSKKLFIDQTTDYYEQWMNVCAREFAVLYPVTNFIKEDNNNGKG